MPLTPYERTDEHREKLRRDHTTHGDFGSPTYWAWGNMLQRCRNPKTDSYVDYGGRGISVCERWSEYVNFRADMGEKPEGMSLDRIDVDGNYEPGNCRWATAVEQANNQRPRKERTTCRKGIHVLAEVGVVIDASGKRRCAACRDASIQQNNAKAKQRKAVAS